MATFCGKCGSRLDPATGLCPNCSAGTPNRTPSVSVSHPEAAMPVWEPAPAPEEPVGEPPAQKKRGPKPWAIVLAVAAVLLTAVVCLGVLTYFEVIEIPGISDLMADIRGDDEEEEENGKKEDPKEAADETTAAAQAEEETEIETEAEQKPVVVPLTLSGLLTEETYRKVNGGTGVIYILILDKEMTFTPYPPFDADLGKSVRTNRVQLLDGRLTENTDKHVTVHGELTFASQDEHRENVLLQNCTVEITVQDEEYNKTNGLTDEVDLSAPGKIVSVSCSTHSGNGANGRVFTPEMAIDGNPDTCWMAAGGKGGSGNWIQFDFGAEKTLYGIQLLNGNLWDDRVNESDPPSDLFHINGRIRDFTLTFSDGTTMKLTAADVKELELSEYGENLFVFDVPVQTSSVRISVDSGYPGNKWDTVVCLAEFAAYFS